MAVFKRSTAVAGDVLSRRRSRLRAVLAGFDDEILLCDCASGRVTCDGPPAEQEAP
jgi:hypothetical protein